MTGDRLLLAGPDWAMDPFHCSGSMQLVVTGALFPWLLINRIVRRVYYHTLEPTFPFIEIEYTSPSSWPTT